MKRKLFILSQILFLLFLRAGCENIIYCQNSKQDTIPTKIIGLSNGCKLVLDAKINLADTITIEIVNGIRGRIQRIQELIPVDSATVNLSINTENILPVWGIGAKTISNQINQHKVETIEIYYDPKHPNFKTRNIIRTLVHEFHHVGRVRMPNFQLALLECMVNEGLADHFTLGFDLRDLARRKKLLIDYVLIERSQITEAGEYNLDGLFVRLAHAVKTIKAKRVVLDSVQALFAGVAHPAILRSELQRLFRWLEEHNLTAIVTGEAGIDTLTRHFAIWA